MSYKLIHFVFCFKSRRAKPTDFCAWLEEEVRKLCIKYGGAPQAVSIHDQNHIHILVDLPPKISESDFMRNVKSRSAYLARRDYQHCGPLWQKRFLFRSVGQSGTAATRKYINRFVREDASRPHSFTSHVIQAWSSNTGWQASPQEDSTWPF